jgi:uncharacterized membrane protein YdbT with pleckstrin-like domain
MLLRRHWLVLVLEIAVVLVLILGGFFLYYELGTTSLPFWSSPYLNGDLAIPLVVQFLPLILIIYLMILWSFAFHSIVDYYLDVWIITDKRIIDIEQHGLFNREISEFNLNRVQDVTVEIRGILATLFDFGNLHVQTAGDHREFVFKQVPDPQKAKTTILQLVNLTSREPNQK